MKGGIVVPQPYRLSSEMTEERFEFAIALHLSRMHTLNALSPSRKVVKEKKKEGTNKECLGKNQNVISQKKWTWVSEDPSLLVETSRNYHRVA